jgi:hypothetical protein
MVENVPERLASDDPVLKPSLVSWDNTDEIPLCEILMLRYPWQVILNTPDQPNQLMVGYVWVGSSGDTRTRCRKFRCLQF